MKSKPPSLRPTLSCIVEIDDVTLKACEPFDYVFDGTSKFVLPKFEVPRDFTLGLIVGPSGSGKSSILKRYFPEEPSLQWDFKKSVVSQIGDDATAKLSAVGLNSVPSWVKPRHVLSNGEGFRADLARRIRSNSVVDEFTSVVDRTTAKAASVGLRRLIDRYKYTGVVLSSCHYDIIEWLQPDWVFDTTQGFLDRGLLRPRPHITLEIHPCRRSAWTLFAKHHYLTDYLLSSAKCWWAWWENSLVGFSSVIPFPHGSIKNARREHRTVILPDFQGFGIGVRLSDLIAKHHVEDLGYRYFSKTAHPRMGEYRDRHPNWKKTSASRVVDPRSRRGTVVKSGLGIDYAKTYHRLCWSHEWKQL